MTIRILAGLCLLPLLLFVFIGGIPLYLLISTLLGIAIKEYRLALEKKDIQLNKFLEWIIPILIFLINIYDVSLLYKITFMIVVIAFINAIIKKSQFKKIIGVIFGLLYIVFGFESIVLIIDNFKSGEIYVWLVFIISVASDVMAYFTGLLFGKHKLAPILSPKKTIEGSLGAIISTLIVCIVYGYIFNLPLYQMCILGILGSMVSQIGDLIASALKRYVGIKDYSNLIPGHGGILDRFDSAILVSQFIFIVLLFML